MVERFFFGPRVFSVRVLRTGFFSITVARKPEDPPGKGWLFTVDWPNDDQIAHALGIDRIGFLEAGSNQGEAIYRVVTPRTHRVDQSIRVIGV